MNKKGYTLIELSVVVFLIGLILLMAIPRVRDAILSDNLTSVTRRLIGTARELRNDAVREQVDYVLHLDLNDNSLWTYTIDMTPEKRDERKKNAFRFPEGIRIADICQINTEKQSDGDATIIFSKKGFLQPTVIHLTEGDRFFTLVFQPFLSTVKIYDTYVDLSLDREKAAGNL